MRATKQCGLATVEFALVGLVLAVVLFGVIELSRVTFGLNVLQEGARRAARVAAVCPVNDPAIANVAILMQLPGLSSDNVITEYLDQTGSPTGEYGQIRYVRVRITNYQFAIAIPLFAPTLDAPEFSSTLPRESLGVPRYGAGAVPCDT